MLEFIWRCKRSQIAKAILNNKNKADNITMPHHKTHYRAAVIKAEKYWHKYRHEGNWNRIEIPKMNPHIYCQLIFDEQIKTNPG